MIEPTTRPAPSRTEHARTLEILREELVEARIELERARSALRELTKVGMALMSERDPRQLFDLILTQARALTTADAGSLYLVEVVEDRPVLRFLRSQNDTLPGLPSLEFELPLDDRSIAGWVATTGEPLVLADVYRLPERLPFSFNREVFDERYGYRAKSMLAVPMIDHKDRVVGVLQLINRKVEPRAKIRTEGDASRWVLPFTDREVAIVSSLAGQAAVSIENGRLHQAIESLFEGFIEAAVTAIDRRDPATSGHSLRVAELTCDVAELVSRQREGPFAEVRFTDEEMKQLRYAGLLHDFGKVGVREEVLVKTYKLPPVMWARLEGRLALVRRTLEAQAAEAKNGALLEAMGGGASADPSRLAAIDGRLAQDLASLERYREAVRRANLPRPLEEEVARLLEEMSSRTFVDADGTAQPYLTPEELHYLSIPRGNLDAEERRQIESHVLHSYDFLRNIPWTEELSRIAAIVRGHHEKLDGSGYPDRVGRDALPLETRIMTVCDIFDALTASDRPYKKAVPVERALDVLRAEADQGRLDADVVELFIESGVYRKVLAPGWRREHGAGA